MVQRISLCKYDVSEINPLAGAINILAATLATCALLNNYWIVVVPSETDPFLELNSTDDAYVVFPEFAPLHTDKYIIQQCRSIGSRNFWFQGKFSTIKRDGKPHIFYRSNNIVLEDCISPNIANYFYVITGFCFTSMALSSAASVLHSLAPPTNFFVWLRRNYVLEICNCLNSCIIFFFTLMAKSAVQELQFETETGALAHVGTGCILMLFSGSCSVLSALSVMRKQVHLRKVRRMDNQRLMCTRTLRSWRDVVQRSEDRRPIIDYERYLLEPGLRGQSSHPDMPMTLENDPIEQLEMENRVHSDVA